MIAKVTSIDPRAFVVTFVRSDGPSQMLRVGEAERGKLSPFMVGRTIEYEVKDGPHGQEMHGIRFLGRPVPPGFPRPPFG